MTCLTKRNNCLFGGLILLVSTSNAYPKDSLASLAVELETPATSSMIEVESIDLGGSACGDWVSQRNWSLGNNAKSNGNEFIVQTGTGVIDAPPGHANYINSRQNAYVKAMLNAKASMLEYMEQSVSREMLLKIKEGEFTHDKNAKNLAQKVEDKRKNGLGGASDKVMKLIHAELDAALTERGVDIDSDNPEVRESSMAMAEELLNSSEFSDLVKSSAKSKMKGVRRVFVNEQVKPGEQGEICVVAIVSDKTMAMADAIFTKDFSLAPKGNYGKPLSQQIPNHKTPAGVLNLFSTFGTEMLRDENGEFYLVAYAQSAPKTKSKSSLNNAVKKASLRAKGVMRTFTQEYAKVDSAVENAESATELSDHLKNYEYNEAFETTIESVSSPIKMNGVTDHAKWAAKHPISGQTVVGVIVKWSASSSRVAQNSKKTMNQTPSTQRAKSKNSTSSNSSGSYSSKGYQGSASGGSEEADF